MAAEVKHLAGDYADQKSATIAAIRTYCDKKRIIRNTAEKEKEAYEKMISPHKANLTGLPSVQNPKAGEDILLNEIDKLDELHRRLRSAREYTAWFEPAWESLTDTERFVLSEFYMGENQKSGATYRIMGEHGYSRRTVERIRQRAIKHLGNLLFG